MLTNDKILEMQGIVKVFPGVKALDNVSLDLYRGKVTSLMGENGAGKSTIMKILFGIIPKTEGTIYYQGNEVNFHSPKQALESGISMVHQELNQVLSTNIVDNIWLGRYPKKFGIFVDKKKAYRDTLKIFKDLDITIDPKSPIERLSVSVRQMIEIAKAVSYDSKVLVLDEPTSSLTDNEVQHLFKIVDRLKEKGVAILFVSHKMDEIFKISDYITIFRDGKLISSKPVAETNRETIIKEMVGRELNNLFPKMNDIPENASTILEVSNLCSEYNGPVDINFTLKEGEILGIAGLVGSKRTEILELLFGLKTKTLDSVIKLRGQDIHNKNPRKSKKHSFAMITEERKDDGIFEIGNINFNSTIANLKDYTNTLKFLKKTKMSKDTVNMIKSLSIKTTGEKQKIEDLSGGNQQKVLLSRWLLTNPDIFLMDEPTRGIDVGAKYQIYELINELSKNGKSVIIVSSELSEIIGICHQILVMSNGKQAGIISGKDATQESIMKLASKYY